MGTTQFSRESECPPNADFANEAPLVYRLYLYTGAFSFVCVFSVLMIYMCNKRLRMHPNGILIHLMLALCAFSLDYFVNGLAYYFKYCRYIAPEIDQAYLRTTILGATASGFRTRAVLRKALLWSSSSSVS